MIEFIAATFNESLEIDDLIIHVWPYVDKIHIVDDVSTDSTLDKLHQWQINYPNNLDWHQMESHTGLPETVKNTALGMCEMDSWVLMLDADERFAEGVLESIRAWLEAPPPGVTHVYFNQLEIIDEHHVRTFQKSKLFKKDAIKFSTGIHEDDQFEGEGLYKEGWLVYHRKTSNKQRQREEEYLATYDKLFEEGKIDEGRRQWLRGLHHYVT